MPEEIFLESRVVKERFGDILEKYKDINHENAKDIVRDISISENGDDQSINYTIKNLANKWSLEESEMRTKLIEKLDIIFEN